MEFRYINFILGLCILCQNGCAQIIPTFIDVTTQSKIKLGGRQVCIGDFNNDGLPDIVSDGYINFNNGDKTFRQGKQLSGWDSLTAGDFGNDGLLDLVAIKWGEFGPTINSEGRSAIFRNSGDETFTRLNSSQYPKPSNDKWILATAWVDINNDGFLDLYICGYEDNTQNTFIPKADVIMKNNGDGTFNEVWVVPFEKQWHSRGVSPADFDNDGDQDIYISNYRLAPNLLWENTGIFNFSANCDIARDKGVQGVSDGPIGSWPLQGNPFKRGQLYGHTIGSAWGDLDNDGDLDLFVSNFAHPNQLLYSDQTIIYENNGPPNFTFTPHRPSDSQIPYQESYSSVTLGDFDNDGLVDAYQTCVDPGSKGRLHRNIGNFQFTEHEPYTERTYMCAWVDYDLDGYLDLVTGAKLYHNNGGIGNHYVRVQVTNGNGNAYGIGSRISVIAGKNTYIREVEGGTGSASNQNDIVQHIGVGSYIGPVTVKVRFPDGTIITANGRTDSTIVVDNGGISKQK